MSSNTFALALLDILGSKGAPASWPAVIKQKENEVKEAEAKRAKAPTDPNLSSVVDEAKAALAKVKELESKATEAVNAHKTAAQAAELVKNPKDNKNLQKASEQLEAALALGRSF